MVGEIKMYLLHKPTLTYIIIEYWWNNIELYLPWRKSRKTSIKANVGAHYHQNKPKWREQEAHLYPHTHQSRSVKKSIHKTHFPDFTFTPKNQMATAVELLPREYGYVVLVLVLYIFLNFWMAGKVGKARRKYVNAKLLFYFFK